MQKYMEGKIYARCLSERLLRPHSSLFLRNCVTETEKSSQLCILAVHSTEIKTIIVPQQDMVFMWKFFLPKTAH